MEQNRNAKPVKGMKGRVPGGQKPSVENPGKVLKRLPYSCYCGCIKHFNQCGM